MRRLHLAGGKINIMTEATSAAAQDVPDKRMKLRYAGTCRLCGTALPAKAEAIYEPSRRTVRCVACPQTPATSAVQADPVADPIALEEQAPSAATPVEPPLDLGQAGASARREYERRKAKDEQRVRDRFGRLAPLALAIRDERQTTSAWDRGAIGEERLGKMLDGLAGQGVVAMHDRRIPRSRANIDHLVITPGGVWVVDAKRYKGRPDLRIEGGIFRPVTKTLVVGSRDCTKLLEGVLRQMELVQAVVPDIEVRGALCFVEADFPLIGGDFTIQGVQVLWPKLLKRRLRNEVDGKLDVGFVAATLAEVFKPA